MEEQGLFPDCSLLDPIDSVQFKVVEVAMDKTVELASSDGLPDDELRELRKLVLDHTDLFQNSFFIWPPADIPPLKVDLVSGARPLRIRSRNYSQRQHEFLSGMV